MTELIERARVMGGERLVAVVQKLLEHGIQLPAYGHNLRKFRGVGDLAVGQLTELGLVATAFQELSLRAQHFLEEECFSTKEEVREAIVTGKIFPEVKRNYGFRTHRELCEWLGLPYEYHKNTPRCPCCGAKLKASKPSVRS